MADNDQKPIVLLLIQGFGLNLSWQKNAIMSAKVDNFTSLWRKYSHLVLGSTNKCQLPNKRFFYESFYADADPRTNKQIVDLAFTKKSITDNKSLQGLYAHTLKHNSKLHFIGILSGDNRFGNIDHLIDLIKISKNNGAYQQYIHLFIDNFSSKSKFLEDFDSLQTKLAKIGSAEIATVSSLDSLYSDDNLREVLSIMLLGKSKKVLSLKQIFSLKEKGADKLGSFMMSNNRALISDFDSVIFFDYDHEGIYPLSKYLDGLFNYSDIRRPKFLKVLYLADAPRGQEDKIICRFKSSPSWFSKLAKKRGVILACKDDCDLISSITDISESIRKVELEDIDRSETQEKLFFERILEFVSDKVSKKKDDLVIVDLPFIARACQSRDFIRLEKTIKNIDSLLIGLESCILKNGGILLISSLYGMAEEIMEVSFPFGKRVQFSSNPLPLIEVSNYSKKPGQSDLGILDLMNIKYNQAYLKKIIMHYLDR